MAVLIVVPIPVAEAVALEAAEVRLFDNAVPIFVPIVDTAVVAVCVAVVRAVVSAVPTFVPNSLIAVVACVDRSRSGRKPCGKAVRRICTKL